jgi:lipopolysaccharide transport system ATP-binding protein
MNTVISIENVSKSYHLGSIGTGTFRGDLQRWWARTRGLPDPHLKIGEKDHGKRQG